MAKKWIICGECEHFNLCKSGQSRMHNVESNSAVYSDIGCFNHEQYIKQTQSAQLKLFFTDTKSNQ